MRAIQQKISVLTNACIDTVLPPRCPVTGGLVDAQGMISPQAWAGLHFISAPFCHCCGIPFDFGADDGDEGTYCLDCINTPPVFDIARSALKYNDASRDIILGFKRGDKTQMVQSFMPWLKRAGSEMLGEADFLIPVPLHRWRLLSRRYNQAGLIAGALSRAVSIPHLPMALRRVRPTVSQGYLNEKDRAENVKKAFSVVPNYAERLKGKTIVLIDDVFTTGATVCECTAALKAAGVARVYVLTLARVVRD